MPKVHPTEIWRDVVGYEGSYQVSDQGRVCSLERLTPHRHTLMRLPTRILKPWSEVAGYLCVTLHKNKVAQKIRMSRLVLTTFVGPCPEGMEACHFPNKDRKDNRLCNLMWGTSKQNHEHMRHQGSSCRNKNYDHVPKGENHPHAKLTNKQVDIIRHRAKNRQRGDGRRMAREFGVSEATICDVVHNRIWRKSNGGTSRLGH